MTEFQVAITAGIDNKCKNYCGLQNLLPVRAFDGIWWQEPENRAKNKTRCSIVVSNGIEEINTYSRSLRQRASFGIACFVLGSVFRLLPPDAIKSPNRQEVLQTAVMAKAYLSVFSKPVRRKRPSKKQLSPEAQQKRPRNQTQESFASLPSMSAALSVDSLASNSLLVPAESETGAGDGSSDDESDSEADDAEALAGDKIVIDK
ncbi:hypothetical protein BDV93DRAFT_516377 [Ceratobasidium sp. AG-I]|nr:hypothetical protein BDV93DRAFT_516377 [Ceratobasidium sp. AG-I]